MVTARLGAGSSDRCSKPIDDVLTTSFVAKFRHHQLDGLFLVAEQAVAVDPVNYVDQHVTGMYLDRYAL
jgi:hypothetical protein